MIKGKNIELVALTSEYENFMLELLNDQDIAYWEGRSEPLISPEKQSKWLAETSISSNHYLIIKSLTDKRAIGYISCKITNQTTKDGHLGIKLIKTAHNQGLGTDALKTSMRYFFYTLNMHRLHTHIVEYNLVSQKLFLDKCGWRKEGIAMKAVYVNGQYFNNVLIAILRDEFYASESDIFYNPLFLKSDLL